MWDFTKDSRENSTLVEIRQRLQAHYTLDLSTLVTTLRTNVTMVAFITKVISIPVVAVLGKIHVDLVFTVVTKVANVHVRPSVCLYGTA